MDDTPHPQRDVRRDRPPAPPPDGSFDATEWPDERPPPLAGDRAETYRARELGPYRRRDAGLYDSGLTDRYPGLRGSGTRDPRIRSTGPGPGAGTDQDPDRASMLAARIAIVATIVVGQLWALTVMLDGWHEGDDGQVWMLLGFQVVSFVFALLVWRAAPTER
jgi:hypothetical protein